MADELRIVIAGSRDFNDFNLLSKNLTAVDPLASAYKTLKEKY